MLNYNAPSEGEQSSIEGTGSAQMNTFFWLKKAIIEARKDQYFMPLSSTLDLPKHYGKEVRVYQWIPLLDDRNINDQGIDANGVTTVNGNLYGSSRDVGTITNKLPALSENGGRVNRVGFQRLQRKGSIHQFGFFYEFTKESLDFDSEDNVKEHLSRELMNGAVQLTEAVLQKDLLAAAGTVLFAGGAVSDATVTGEITPAAGPVPEIPASVVSYQNLMRLDKILTDNRTPKQTKIISGSRNIDTRVISGGRVMFVSSELASTLKGMKDLFGNKAFIEPQHYADAGTLMNGEIGSVDAFRFIQVPEMLHWAGAGAEVVDNPGYHSTTVGGTERYDVYPMLVVGDDSFQTIGFQTDGKTVKFSVITKMPGNDTADRNDPYGLTGFSSIRWYYGILVKRPERIALIKCVAPI
jgi:N4-gp56 family major capsid protein